MAAPAASTMSSRSPGVMSSTPRLKNCIALCAPIAPTMTSSTSVCSVGGVLSSSACNSSRIKSTVGLHRICWWGKDAEQFQALALEAAPGESVDFGIFSAEHLVEDDADDFDAFLFKQRLVESRLRQSVCRCRPG